MAGRPPIALEANPRHRSKVEGQALTGGMANEQWKSWRRPWWDAKLMTMNIGSLLERLVFAAIFMALGFGLPAQAAGETHSSHLGMVFVPIPGTTILMAKHETRVLDFAAFVKARSYEWAVRPHFPQESNHPVVGINLADALAFCAWLTEEGRAAGSLTQDQSYRLPTRQEWSSAAGIPSARDLDATGYPKAEEVDIHPWGKDWPPPSKAANLAEGEIPGYQDGYPFTSPVGSFLPTADGIHDLAGNVWEWTLERELRGRGEGILRGGSWAYFKRECLTSGYQYAVPTDLRAPTFGFRCVLDDRTRTQSLRLAAAGKAATESKVMDDDFRKRREERELELKKMQSEARGKAKEREELDTSALAPWEVGKRYVNALRLIFPPSEGDSKVAFCATETTLAALQTWADQAGRNVPEQPHFVNDERHPVVNISWAEASDFCHWLTGFERERRLIPDTAEYRLPTDEEWSTAAGLKQEVGTNPLERATAAAEHFIGVKYPPASYSVNIEATKVQDGFDDKFPYVGPVAAMPPDAGPLHDMGGNVSEWCLDSWPPTETEAVIRGASWLSSEKAALSTSHRIHRPKDSRRYDIGFRIVLETAP